MRYIEHFWTADVPAIATDGHGQSPVGGIVIGRDVLSSHIDHRHSTMTHPVLNARMEIGVSRPDQDEAVGGHLRDCRAARDFFLFDLLPLPFFFGNFVHRGLLLGPSVYQSFFQTLERRLDRAQQAAFAFKPTCEGGLLLIRIDVETNRGSVLRIEDISFFDLLFIGKPLRRRMDAHRPRGAVGGRTVEGNHSAGHSTPRRLRMDDDQIVWERIHSDGIFFQLLC